MKWIPFFGSLALSVALGALVVGYGLLLPSLEMDHHFFVDANLAKSLSHPLSLRLAEVLLVAQLILVFLLPRWITHRLATTVGIVLLAFAIALRWWLIPEVYDAWSRVDLVAKRPADALQIAYQWTLYQYLALGGMVVGNMVLLWLTTRPLLRTSRVNSSTSEKVA